MQVFSTLPLPLICQRPLLKGSNGQPLGADSLLGVVAICLSSTNHLTLGVRISKRASGHIGTQDAKECLPLLARHHAYF